MRVDELRWDADGLIPAVAQQRHSGEVRMVAYANREALEATLQSGTAHFYSRSRRELWRKGATSGNGLKVFEVWADCDGDALLYLVEAEGPSCHTGERSCFFHRLDRTAKGVTVLSERPAVAASSEAGSSVAEIGEGPSVNALQPNGLDSGTMRPGAAPTLLRLWDVLQARSSSDAAASYTRSLLDRGLVVIGDKVREEADEMAKALVGESDERVVCEAADLVYHLMVGLLSRRQDFQGVAAEMARRFGRSGHDEKQSRHPHKGNPPS